LNYGGWSGRNGVAKAWLCFAIRSGKDSFIQADAMELLANCSRPEKDGDFALNASRAETKLGK
jgi:hypothetical protein